MDLIRFLIQHGADITIKDFEGGNVLHAAADNDKAQALYYFIYKFGMDVDSKD